MNNLLWKHTISGCDVSSLVRGLNKLRTTSSRKLLLYKPSLCFYIFLCHSDNQPEIHSTQPNSLHAALYVVLINHSCVYCSFPHWSNQKVLIGHRIGPSLYQKSITSSEHSIKIHWNAQYTHIISNATCSYTE